jgi:hypothetical protein
VLRLLLWNINSPADLDKSSALLDALQALLDEIDLDLVAFVEPPSLGSGLHARLLASEFHFWFNSDSRFAIFSKFSSRLAESFQLPSIAPRYEAWKIVLSGLADLNLFLVHGRD